MTGLARAGVAWWLAFCLWLGAFAPALAASKTPAWSFMDEFSLKKDEFILYKVGERDLLFRWTLFHNDGLVFVLKYDLFAYHGILYANYKLNSFRITTSAGAVGFEKPYCDIVFVSCNKDRSLCDFKLMCHAEQPRKVTEKE
ncbi:MAG: hypothetical protein ACTTIC_05715 [Helicobacteraceae bacterium]